MQMLANRIFMLRIANLLTYTYILYVSVVVVFFKKLHISKSRNSCDKVVIEFCHLDVPIQIVSRWVSFPEIVSPKMQIRHVAQGNS